MTVGDPAQIQVTAPSTRFLARLRPRRRARARYKRDEVIMGYLFILIPMTIFTVFFLGAMVFDFWISFYHWAILDSPRFVGSANYNYIFHTDPTFWIAIQNTVVYAAVVVPLQTVIAFTLALIVNQDIRGRTFFRTTFYFPSITSSIAISLIFLFMFNNFGLLNTLISYLPNLTIPGVLYYLIRLLPAILLAAYLIRDPEIQALRSSPDDILRLSRGVWIVAALLVLYVLNFFGLIYASLSAIWTVPGGLHSLLDLLSLNISQSFQPAGPNWLGDPAVALKSIMGLNIWTTTGTIMIVFLAALQGVPRDVLEAAAIDGASGFQAIIRIVVPLVRPALFFVVANGIIGCLQIFDQAFLLSHGSGGPENSTMTAVLWIYNNAFQNDFYGVAAAASFFLFAFIFVATIVTRRLIGEEAS
jgi:multiple sugar transport system permease protein